MNKPPKFQFPALKKFYNIEKSKTAFITMDVDWAPDSILEYAFNWFLENEIAFTAFMTHKSAIAKKFENHPLVEIGIHPNFSKNNDPLTCVRELRKIYPKSIGSRSHQNICGRHVTDALFAYGYKYHVNKLLWNISHAECTLLYNGMVEAPYMWEEGVHLEMNIPPDINEISLDSPGLKILNIHPMLFYLNCTDDNQRKSATKHFTDLTTAPLSAFEDSINHKNGISIFCKEMFLKMKSSGFHFCLLRDMMLEAYKSNLESPPFEWNDTTR